jgi:hypothetical protein
MLFSGKDIDLNLFQALTMELKNINPKEDPDHLSH